jgi:hypothetical protein
MKSHHSVTLNALAGQTCPYFTKRTHSLNWCFTHDLTLASLQFCVYAKQSDVDSNMRCIELLRLQCRRALWFDLARLFQTARTPRRMSARHHISHSVRPLWIRAASKFFSIPVSRSELIALAALSRPAGSRLSDLQSLGQPRSLSRFDSYFSIPARS